jgi:hypothetical protein
VTPRADQGQPDETENDSADDELGRLILRVEAKTHRNGWDKAPQLYALARRADQRVAATALFPAHEPVSPYVLLHATRFVAESEFFAEHLRPRLGTEHCGFLLVFEGWSRTDAHALATDARRDFADQPGSRDCRMALLCTTDGRDYSVTRIRGEQPTLNGYRMGGAVHDAPADLTRLIAHRIDE